MDGQGPIKIDLLICGAVLVSDKQEILEPK